MKGLEAILALGLGIGTALLTDEVRAADVIRLGEGPFISGGGFFVAQGLGYFKKLGLDVQIREFQDGALAVPSFISGELDMSFMTANASLFNSIAKGAPLVIILDRGHNRPGRAYTVINVSQDHGRSGCPFACRFRQAQGQTCWRGRAWQHQPVQRRQGLSEGGPRSRQGRAVGRQCAAAGPHEDARPEVRWTRPISPTSSASSRRTTNGAR